MAGKTQFSDKSTEELLQLRDMYYDKYENQKIDIDLSDFEELIIEIQSREE